MNARSSATLTSISTKLSTIWRLTSRQGAYLTGRGVPGSGGVDIGKVQLMLKARPLQGMRVDLATGARHKVKDPIAPVQIMA